MDDILRRLGNVETAVFDVREQVSAISAIIPHLATKADLADVRTAVVQVKADVAAVETAIIKWIIATTLTVAALAFTIAKVVH